MRLLARLEVGLQRDRAVIVIAAARSRRRRIAFREQRGSFCGSSGVVVRSLSGRIDQLAIFRAGDVTDRGFVNRSEERRSERQQRKRGAQPAKQSTTWADAVHRAALDAPAAALFNRLGSFS